MCPSLCPHSSSRARVCPGGISSARRAAGYGAKVAVIEAGRLGGTWWEGRRGSMRRRLAVGCVASFGLLPASHRITLFTEATWSTSLTWTPGGVCVCVWLCVYACVQCECWLRPQEDHVQCGKRVRGHSPGQVRGHHGGRRAQAGLVGDLNSNLECSNSNALRQWVPWWVRTRACSPRFG